MSLHFQIHCLITLHETFNDLMLYKDVSELTDLCFKHNNVCRITLKILTHGACNNHTPVRLAFRRLFIPCQRKRS